MSRGWTLLPTLVVRTAGFPWEYVDRLALPGVRPMLAELHHQHVEAARLGAALVATGRFPRKIQSRLRNLRPLPADAPVDPAWQAEWNAVARRVGEIGADLGDRYESDLAAVDAAVTGLLNDPWFMDAVCCSSPAAYRDLSRGARTGRLRRQVGAYAQRLSAKCETMSFFGPINYGVVAPHRPEPASVEWSGHRHLPRRVAFVAARVYDAIQAAVLDRPALVAQLILRRKTWLRALPASGTLAPYTRELVSAADGRRPVAKLGGEIGATGDELVTAVREAMRRGLVTHQLCPPATVVDPLEWTRRALAGLVERDADLEEILAGLAQALQDHPAASPQEKLRLQSRVAALTAQLGAARDVTAATGAVPAVRDRFYNDRVIVHEAAVGTLRVTVGGALAADLCGTVPAVLNLLARDAAETRALTNRAVARRLGPGRFGMTRAMRRCADLTPVSSSWLTEQLEALVADLPAGAVEADIAALLAVPAPDSPVLCSVDVLVATTDLPAYREGETPLVLGDIHDAALLTPWAMQFHPHPERCLAERDARIRDALGELRAVSVISRRSTGLPPLEFPGPVVELGGTSARPDAERIGLDELLVHSDGERVRLCHAGTGEPLVLHNGELDQGLHTALALPRIRRLRLPDLDHVPRLRYRNVVVSRRRWRVASAELAGGSESGAARLAAVAALRARHDLPDRFFAKSTGERKPIFVDTTSPALLDGLTRLAGTAETLDLSEVLPGPEHFWLHDGPARFAAELRCVYLHPAAPERTDRCD